MDKSMEETDSDDSNAMVHKVMHPTASVGIWLLASLFLVCWEQMKSQTKHSNILSLPSLQSPRDSKIVCKIISNI